MSTPVHDLAAAREPAARLRLKRKVKMDTREFLVKPGAKVDLKRRPTLVAPFYRSNKDYGRLLEAHIAELNRLQGLLWADHRFALLVVIQGMDASGKDSAVKHVMSGVNPQGCEVHSFKPPSAEELAHDFLWRTTRSLPGRGHIGIFNRSHYEEVVVVRVRAELLDREGLPAGLAERPGIWEGRFQSIVDW